ncbi:GTP-binding protein GEM-like [Ylistrum balloti]|uniref:GTP-binding protein GEM-like n=1 Tax=Ylistrum balloti TaxID=509963 RepID=UPI002905E43D|nr:GTP-binding protein GEM-like [Ylistrum balloti]
MNDSPSSRFLSPDSAVGIHHTRARSFKSRSRTRDIEDSDYCERPRRNSMPSRARHQILSSSFNDLFDNTENEQPQSLRRVRSFKTTSRGVVNRGDSYKKKSSKDVLASGVTIRDENPELQNLDNHSNRSTPKISTSTCSDDIPKYYQVVVLGSDGVGKTALTDQFMTSEYIGPTDTGSIDLEEDKMITVLLDGEESTLVFCDRPEEVDLDETQVDAFLVVYSTNDRRTFEAASDLLYQLRHEVATDRAIILVANKIDLARKRQVSADEARSIAVKLDCKYAETSAALNHHVDELLVGILKQIRLKLSHDSLGEEETKKGKERKGSFKAAKGLLHKLFRKSSRKERSCDNLHQL